jgi:hypothetical protein
MRRPFFYLQELRREKSFTTAKNPFGFGGILGAGKKERTRSSTMRCSSLASPASP